MKPLVLVVDDNEGILYNLRLLLRLNNYDVITSSSAKEALRILNEAERLPDVIVSDIMMPEMDGYDFFKIVSNNDHLNHIPFVFLSAKATPDDVRYGKSLGIDDYIVKPFDEDDFLAIIQGKIKKLNNLKKINEKLIKKIELLEGLDIKKLQEEVLSKVCVLFIVVWDEIRGPALKSHYPRNVNLPFSLQDVSVQLFHVTIPLYGYGDYSRPQDILLRPANISMSTYLLFNSIHDPTVRGERRIFMIGLITERISHLQSLLLKKLFTELAEEIMDKNTFDLPLDEWFNKAYNIINKPVTDDQLEKL